MEYRVLARKYRPSNFDHLIGQDVLVRTLSNAIATGRIAHGFLLTGIRGVGKTTTARIIAKALNCIGPDGNGGPTIKPCGECSNCTMIAEGRHVDVLEMDAASHTGVGDIRELIDSVRYLPSSARYKVYIIDEVHMLSNSAFNALLKTLEEPPEHVKFIFATTEVRKIPVTILSRCQRFDLKRVDADLLANHLHNIATQENVQIDEKARQLIALCAEGSVRDALSLMDQAIAQAGSEAVVTEEATRQMIGHVDHSTTFAMLEKLLSGNVPEALELLHGQYQDGADPLMLVQDYMDIVHLITRVKVVPNAADDVSLSQQDRESSKYLADHLHMAALTRLWQMLIKGAGEVRMAPSPIAALEMLLIRVAYAAQLPTPAEAIRSDDQEQPASHPTPQLVKKNSVAPAAAAPRVEQPAPTVSVESFEALVELCKERREALLYTQLKQTAQLVRFAQGELAVHMPSQASREFAPKLAECLKLWTGHEWNVTLSDVPGAPSLQQQEIQRQEQAMEEAAKHPLVGSVLEQFPGAKLVGVKEDN